MYGKKKHAMDHKPVLLKPASNKLGKYPYNKKTKGRIINFEIPPADHLTKKFIIITFREFCNRDVL